MAKRHAPSKSKIAHEGEPEAFQALRFNLEGAAAEWFQWMTRNGLITTWARFEESVKNCFGPSEYEDPNGVLSKLLQVRTVKDYQQEFEKLMNRATDIPDSLLISYYIYGLKLHLQPPIEGTSAGLEANKVVNDESTYDNDARDQVNELKMNVLVNGKQDEAKVVKVVVVAVEQNINEPDVVGEKNATPGRSKRIRSKPAWQKDYAM
nr:Ty3/gypsy retrotransposon protein [Tanacetum cinerariifolium]